MPKTRLEAFTDGVIAIIITILVLDIRLPEANHSWAALRNVLPIFSAYVMSFATVATVWINHHHLFLNVKRVTDGVLWANLTFLFFLSLLPAVTAWFGSDIRAVPAACLYELDIIAFNFSFLWLRNVVVKADPEDVRAVHQNREYVSMLNNFVILGLVFLWPPFVFVGFLVNSLLWYTPSRHIEQAQ
ncbi:hypothetical protein IV38_GL001674 [Lactobacillus selangorensis]|uniref:Integral membrane protein n=1 Tax=Lactobacillus selangorensis TaxID=81857 RepID=A0A0R2FSW1_9LACO|nr:TMEM175 family protein [Lactobacillus selangorensis]KRN28220.1 hypothetical protein IV38_GL001674 [Lactobacillus selangorensis]KRN30904.1 hypothetical protein IV40_GL001541 [Lactobacillus selangorensis]